MYLDISVYRIFVNEYVFAHTACVHVCGIFLECRHLLRAVVHDGGYPQCKALSIIFGGWLMTHCHPFDGQHPITIVFRLLRGEVMGRRHKEGTEQKPVSGTQECYRHGLHFTSSHGPQITVR